MNVPIVESPEDVVQPVDLNQVNAELEAEYLTAMEEANDIIYGDREQTYGHPAKNFENTAALWRAYLSAKYAEQDELEPRIDPWRLDGYDVAYMMALLKLAREMHQHKRDNLVDMIGYIGCVEKMRDVGYAL